MLSLTDPGQQQLRLAFAEPQLYLRSELERATHFAILWRDPDLTRRARESSILLQQRQRELDGIDLTPGLKKELSTLKKAAYRDKRQQCYPVKQLPQILAGLPRDRDTWISQSIFFTPAPDKGWRPNRRKISFASTAVAFVDFDTYNKDGRGHFRDADHVLQFVLARCREHGMPEPSCAIDSGRGVHIKYIMPEGGGTPRRALPRWEALEREMIAFFARWPELGTDKRCKDASRVLRLDQTLNQKAGRYAEVLWVNEDVDGDPLTYSLDELCLAFLPYTREEIQSFKNSDIEHELEARAARNEYRERGKKMALERAQRQAAGGICDGGRRDSQEASLGLQYLTNTSLSWNRFCDLEALAEMRGWDRDIDALSGGVPQGCRSDFVLYCLSFFAMSGRMLAKDFYGEASTFVQRFAPELLKHRDTSVWSTLFEKVKAFNAGRTVTYRGREYPAIYTPKSQLLIDLFGITPDEQRKLVTIIGSDERRRRDRDRDEARRRAAGAVPRAEYLASAQARQERARALREDGLSINQIAATMGCSRSAIKNYVRQR